MKKLIILCMFFCIVGSSLQADEEEYFYVSLFRSEVVDARSSALGGTTVLTTFGSNALFTNPANLGMLDKQYFQAGARAMFGSEKTEYKQQGADDYESSYLFHPKFNHVSYAMPYNIPNSGIQTVFAAGYRTYFDYGYTYYHEYNDKSSDEYTFKMHGGFNTLSLGGAVNFNDKIFGGLAYNIGIMSKTSYWEDYNGEEDDGDLFNFKGSFLTVGGIFKPTDRISLGLTFTPGFEFELEDDDSGYTSDVDIPSQLALSAMFELSESFTGIIEYQNRPWKNYEEGGDEVYGDIDNGMCLRAGVEFGKLLRLGFFSNSVPMTDTNSSGESEDKPLSLVGFTGGIGLNVSPQMILDLSGEYSFINIEDNEYDYQSETKISLFKFGATFTYILF